MTTRVVNVTTMTEVTIKSEIANVTIRTEAASITATSKITTSAPCCDVTVARKFKPANQLLEAS